MEATDDFFDSMMCRGMLFCACNRPAHCGDVSSYLSPITPAVFSIGFGQIGGRDEKMVVFGKDFFNFFSFAPYF